MLLKNKDTGAVFTYTAELAKLPHMIAHTPQSDIIEPHRALGQQFLIAEAESTEGQDWKKIGKKSDLAEYARLTYGIELDEYGKLQDMRSQFIAALQARETPAQGG